MLTKGIIDRFESDYAIIELKDNTFVDVLIKLLPSTAKEGDFVNINIEIDKKGTENQKYKIEGLLEKLQKKNL